MQVDARRYRRLCGHRAGHLAALPPRGGMHERVLEQQAVLWRARPRLEGPEQGLFGPEQLYRARRHHREPPEAAGPCHYARADGRAEYGGKVGRGPGHLPLQARLDAAAQLVQGADLAGKPLHRLQVLVGHVAAAAAPRRGREHLRPCGVEPGRLKVPFRKAAAPAGQYHPCVPRHPVDKAGQLGKVQAVPLAHAQVEEVGHLVDVVERPYRLYDVHVGAARRLGHPGGGQRQGKVAQARHCIGLVRREPRLHQYLRL